MGLEDMVEQDKRQEPIDILKRKLEELNQLYDEKVYLNRGTYIYRFRKWHDDVEYILRDLFGERSRELRNFSTTANLPAGKAREAQWIEHRRLTLVKSAAALQAILSAPDRLSKPIKHQIAVPKKTPVANDDVNNLFDKMKLHPKIIEVGEPLFKDGHYAQAILEAFKAVNNFVKQKANKSLDGKALMSEVFSERNPCIKLNELKTQSELDEQEGFKFLYMGAMVGIRNPNAHDMVQQEDPYKTLEYLAFASLLIKRIDF